MQQEHAHIHHVISRDVIGRHNAQTRVIDRIDRTSSIVTVDASTALVDIDIDSKHGPIVSGCGATRRAQEGEGGAKSGLDGGAQPCRGKHV